MRQVLVVALVVAASPVFARTPLPQAPPPARVPQAPAPAAPDARGEQRYQIRQLESVAGDRLIETDGRVPVPGPEFGREKIIPIEAIVGRVSRRAGHKGKGRALRIQDNRYPSPIG